MAQDAAGAVGARLSPPIDSLIRAAQRGDQDAFEQLVRAHDQSVLRLAMNLLRSPEDARDVYQEAFLRVYRNKHLYRNIAKFSTWIYTIAGNLAKTELRRRKRRRLFSISQMGFDNKDYDVPDPLRTADVVVDGDMKEAFIRKEIDALPVKFKEVVVLRDIDEFSYEEISDILKIPIGTVKSRVNRGRLRLQKRLGDLLEN